MEIDLLFKFNLACRGLSVYDSLIRLYSLGMVVWSFLVIIG
jgi:hypothetical protein